MAYLSNSSMQWKIEIATHWDGMQPLLDRVNGVRGPGLLIELASALIDPDNPPRDLEGTRHIGWAEG